MDIISYQMGQNSVPEQKPEEAKLVNIYSNGRTTVTPQSGYALSKVDVQVSVPNPSTGVINITENGFYDTMTKAGVNVNVPQGITPLAKTVTFKNGTDNYQIVTVTDEQTVEQPPTNPTSPTALFSGWQKSGSYVSFPYTPIGNDTIDAFFSSITADTVYGHYSHIDRNSFPYFFIYLKYNGGYNYCNIIFSSYYTVYSSVLYLGQPIYQSEVIVSEIVTPLSDLINLTFNSITEEDLIYKSYGENIQFYAPSVLATNIQEATGKFSGTTYILT